MSISSAGSQLCLELPRIAPVVVSRAESEREWDDFVTSHPAASAYHTWRWRGLLERAFGLRSVYLIAHRDREVVGVLPLVLFRGPLFGRFAVSMPFLNYGGVLANSDAAAGALLASAIDVARDERAGYVELRHSTRCFTHLPVRTHKVAMVLRLQQTCDDQWRVLDRKLRNQVRKAEKADLRVRVGGLELLDAFYDVLSRNMRDLGSPVHSRRFFEEIVRTFPECTRIVSVWLDSTPVAASFVFWHADRLEVPWASSLKTHNHLCANVLLYWEMLKFGIERHFAEFDFGRSTPLEGTYKFKEQWGAEPRQLYWEYWLSDGAQIPDRSPKNPKFSAMISLWRHLPVAITRVIGPLLVRNIP